MPRPYVKTASIALLAAATASCGPAIPAYRIAELPSGRIVRLLGVEELPLANGGEGLRLAYETDLDLADRRALYLEVEAIWRECRHTEAAAGKSAVVIEATTPETRGWSRQRAALEYRLQLGPDGDWQFVSPIDRRPVREAG